MPMEKLMVFMVVIVTCKNQEEPIKNEGVRVVTDGRTDGRPLDSHPISSP